MKVLAIETSCDETAAAVVATTGDPAKPWQIASNVIASQAEIHREWGGVVPEIASRQHVRDICGVVERALADADTTWAGIDAVAVTQGPGLVGSLLVGVSFAKAAAAALGKPVVAVHHLAGHIESIFLEHGAIPLPAAILVVAGGHTSLYLVSQPGQYQLVGRTRDDAAGEAYDKVARLLGLGYPGGPAIDRVAMDGDPSAIRFPRALADEAYDFSFSGVKTSVVTYLRKHEDVSVEDVAASFQEAVVDVLVTKARRAAKDTGAKSLCLAGGVAANSVLRERALDACIDDGLRAYLPSRPMCTDNAAMIAAAGWWRLASDGPSGLDAGADPNLRLPVS